MDATLVRLGIPGIALALCALFVVATWRTGAGLAPAARLRRTILAAAGCAIWLAAQAAAALSGWLGRFELRPPPILIWFMSMVAMTLALAWSSFGRRFADKLPFVALIGFQAFRLPLELVMHRAVAAGIMPNVMSFTGYNFDIVTGATALPLALYAWRRPLPRRLVLLWNLTGQILLIVVAAVALAASPIFRAFGDEQLNVWVTQFPYVWIAVMVAAALFGHVVTMRKLLAERRAEAPAAAAATP
ncbi:MAG TPA: hypothetical protein VIF57_10795 [Polyangia bacterium]|jgi:hypothetical protein